MPLTNFIDKYIPNDELKGYMHGILNDIEFHVKEAYNLELIELKLQLEYLVWFDSIQFIPRFT